MNGGINMENFIDSWGQSHRFTYEGDFGILTLGYNNFKIKFSPEYSSRVQNFYTWHFVISGKGILKTGGNTYDISGGQMFFLPPDTEICYFPKEEDPWEYVWFSLKGEICKYYGEVLKFDTPVKEIKNLSYIKHLLKESFEKLNQGGGYFGLLSTFYELMEICTVTSPDKGIDTVKKIIDEGFTRTDFSIEELCSDVGISHPHLLRLFKEKYNITLIKYLNQKRIEYACKLLLTTDLSVKSVAFSSGFYDELHFMKTFKKHMGKSALKYKKDFLNKEHMEKEIMADLLK